MLPGGPVESPPSFLFDNAFAFNAIASTDGFTILHHQVIRTMCVNPSLYQNRLGKQPLPSQENIRIKIFAKTPLQQIITIPIGFCAFYVILACSLQNEEGGSHVLALAYNNLFRIS